MRTILLLLLLLATTTAAQVPAAADTSAGRRYYFYHRLDYGSDAMVHPLRLILNGSFGILQMGNRSNDLTDIHYSEGWTNVWRNLSHPLTSIRYEGWWTFLKREIIPISFNAEGARYWPNYTNHLIGGGMSYRLMREWYRYHGYSHESRWAIGTLAVYHLLNEVVENDARHQWTTDPVADIYLFDVGSIILFENDRVCGFFADKLHMADWSFQPVYDPSNRNLYNAGANYVIKVPLPRSRHWSFFYHWGNHAESGLSYTKDNGECWSVGAGLKAKNLIKVTEYSDGVELAVTAGLFYDRNNSLLGSLLYAKSRDAQWRLNLYPGLIRLGRWRPGLFVALNDDHTSRFGVTFTWAPAGYGWGAAPRLD